MQKETVAPESRVMSNFSISLATRSCRLGTGVRNLRAGTSSSSGVYCLTVDLFTWEMVLIGGCISVSPFNFLLSKLAASTSSA